MEDIVYSPSEFAAVFNQTLEFAYPRAVVEGELSGYKLSRGKWVYFDLQDEAASLKCFGNAFLLPGPLEDGMRVRVVAAPRLHPRFGFSLNLFSITPIGEGTLKKAVQLLSAKLQKEGLFDPSRKRLLPAYPEKIGLITAEASAAYADFIKITNERWGGVEITVVDSLVQGDGAPGQIARAIEMLNKSSILPEVIVITRGGGSAEDLVAFNDERVVRAIAASRIPTLVAIGHETDESLSELVADVRASTPTNAAQLVVPDKTAELERLVSSQLLLGQQLSGFYRQKLDELSAVHLGLIERIHSRISNEKERLAGTKRLVAGLDPATVLRRGYSIARQDGRLLKSIQGIKKDQLIELELSDGRINTTVKEVISGV